jgi:hypothetical protein
MDQPLDQKEKDDFLDEYIQPVSSSTKFWLGVAGLLIFAVLAWVFKATVIDISMSGDELRRSITLFDISSQWTVKEQNDDPDFKGITLVPEVSFRFRNTGRRELRYVYLLGVFRFMPTGKFIGEGYQMTLRTPLPPGGESEPIVLRCGFGYKASSAEAFEKNRRNWMNSYVELFTKSKNSRYVMIKTLYVSRRIAGMDVEVTVK